MRRIFTLFFPAFIFAGSYAANPGGALGYIFPKHIKQGDYLEGTLIIKVKPGYRENCRNNSIEIPALKEKLESLLPSSIVRKFPSAGVHAKAGSKAAGGDISLIYEIRYEAPVSIPKAINALLQTGVLEYAEPKFVQQPLYTPNDPSIGSQYYLNTLKVYQAWDISQGDSNVVIGITDTGFDLDHPDMAGSVKHNYSDPVNGLDDDGDGYIDNFTGWDLGQGDNDPSVNPSAPPATKPFHGVEVAGFAGARVDNNTGMAGIGFKCRILPVKVTDASGYITTGYEGIVYAADHGCKIINCSWGAPDGGSSFGQDIIDYAVSKGALVVAAAGNSNSEVPFFPASYKGVFSVTATNSTDRRWSASSYGIYVDVSAPGEGVYTTNYNDSYVFDNGTSYASPIAAASAAIVQSHFPSFNGLQVAEKLRITSDLIDTVPGNGPYAEKLGTGRINLYRALTEDNCALRMISTLIKDNNDSLFTEGDTLRITGTFKNYLSPTPSAVLINLSSTSPYVTVLNPNTSISALGTLATASNTSPFRVKVGSSVPANTRVVFKLTYSCGAYIDKEFFEVILNPDYINININDIAATITSSGRIGYNTSGAGIGFSYKGGPSLVYEMGIMVGADTARVSDCVRGNSLAPDEDFQTLLTVRRVIPSVKSDYDLLTRYNDNPAGAEKLNITMSQRTFAWQGSPDNKYIIVDYSIRNTGSVDYNSLYAGIFCDWDVMNAFLNKAATDPANKTGYVYSTQPNSIYAGIRLLRSNAFRCYSLDNSAGGAGGFDISDGYSTHEKYKTLSTGRASSGNPSGNDVSHVVSAGPFTLLAGDSVTVAFALLAGDSLQDLLSSGIAAETKYSIITSAGYALKPAFKNLSLYPNPVSDRAILRFYSERETDVTFEVIAATGERQEIVFQGKAVMGLNQVVINPGPLTSGIYFYRLISGPELVTGKFIVVK